jgi:hypothetical protein
MHGAIPPLPNTPSWRGRDNRTFTFTLTVESLKSKCLLRQTMKTYESVKVIEKAGGHFHAAAALPWYPLDGMLDGVQEPVWTQWWGR